MHVTGGRERLMFDMNQRADAPPMAERDAMGRADPQHLRLSLREAVAPGWHHRRASDDTTGARMRWSTVVGASLGAAFGWAAETRVFRRMLLWIGIVSLLGAADEWHQQFIPSRSMDVRDWLADTAGAVTGLSLVTALTRRRESVA